MSWIVLVIFITLLGLGIVVFFAMLAGPDPLCPLCRGSVPKGALVCQHCGRELPLSAPVWVNRRSKSQRPRAGVHGWHCPFCSGYVPKGAPVCQHCGRDLGWKD